MARSRVAENAARPSSAFAFRIRGLRLSPAQIRISLFQFAQATFSASLVAVKLSGLPPLLVNSNSRPLSISHTWMYPYRACREWRAGADIDGHCRTRQPKDAGSLLSRQTRGEKNRPGRACVTIHVTIRENCRGTCRNRFNLNTPGRTRTFDPLLRRQRRAAYPVGSPWFWSVSVRSDTAHSEKIEYRFVH